MDCFADARNDTGPSLQEVKRCGNQRIIKNGLLRYARNDTGPSLRGVKRRGNPRIIKNGLLRS